MDITMEYLEAVGKQSFDVCFQLGDFYFPKVVWQHVGGDMKIGMYETDFELLVQLCQEIAKEGPLEFIGHTADTYYLETSQDSETAELIRAGKTTASEQFEEENPNASEALSILLVDAKDNISSRTLLYKRQGRTLRWGKTIDAVDEPGMAGRYVALLAFTVKASYAAA